jgi:6-phosphogluconate dehydrogenase (decarboxylating)
MQLGMIGLGRMGGNMVRRLLKSGHQCVVYNESANTVAELVKEKAVGTTSLADFAKKLTKPRAVWLMVPTGVVDNVIADLLPYLERGDILVDGGNSYYIDDIRRAKDLASRGIHYVDVGTSGGISIRSSLRLRQAAAIFRARRAAKGSTARPSRAICIADRMAPAISSKWSTTGSNTE